MVNGKYVIGLVAFMVLLTGVSGLNQSVDSYCPALSCVNNEFRVVGELKYNGTSINNAEVYISNVTDRYNLSYNNLSERYLVNLVSPDIIDWDYTLYLNSTYDNVSVNCTTKILSCYNLTVTIWEEEAYKTVANNSNYVVRVKNYDKELNDHYINDFAYIIAKNKDQNATGAYKGCNIPFPPNQNMLDLSFIDNYLSENSTELLFGDLKDSIGCEDYWFRSEYNSGEAVLELPYAGNYSIYLVDGVVQWENKFSTPKIVKSNLFLYLGELTIPDKIDYTVEYWISHAELDAWGSLLDQSYVFIVTIGAFILLIGLILIGVPIKFSVGLILLWEVSWTLLRLL